MAASSTLKLTCTYSDQEERIINISPIQSSKLPSDLKLRIRNLNDATQRATNYPNFDTAFVSDYGGNFVRISKAQIVTTEKVVLS